MGSNTGGGVGGTNDFGSSGNPGSGSTNTGGGVGGTNDFGSSGNSGESGGGGSSAGTGRGGVGGTNDMGSAGNSGMSSQFTLLTIDHNWLFTLLIWSCLRGLLL